MSRFEELIDEVADLRTDLRASEKRAAAAEKRLEATEKKLETALKGLRTVGDRTAAAERQVTRTEQRVERQIGRAASDATRFVRDLASRLGRLQGFVESEGFQQFFSRVDGGDEIGNLERGLGVAGDITAASSKLGGILPVVGAVGGASIGALLGSIREDMRREGLQRASAERDRAFEARLERVAAAEAERRQITGQAKAIAAIQEQQRQARVGVELVERVEAKAAAFRRARAGALR